MAVLVNRFVIPFLQPIPKTEMQKCADAPPRVVNLLGNSSRQMENSFRLLIMLGLICQRPPAVYDLKHQLGRQPFPVLG